MLQGVENRFGWLAVKNPVINLNNRFFAAPGEYQPLVIARAH